ncbi:protein-disulfide reductase DsbD domain-containing protein [Roseobacteraceae bacterium S113]
MEPGWKTYWRSPGEVGLPPELDWSRARNVADVSLLYPAPERFTAFEIENFGYGGTVIFPLQIALEEPGAPVTLTTDVQILVCADICIPERFSLSLDLPAGAGVDRVNADVLAEAIARVPQEASVAGVSDLATHLSAERLIITATRDRPFSAPQVFPKPVTLYLARRTYACPMAGAAFGRACLWSTRPMIWGFLTSLSPMAIGPQQARPQC